MKMTLRVKVFTVFRATALYCTSWIIALADTPPYVVPDLAWHSQPTIDAGFNSPPYAFLISAYKRSVWDELISTPWLLRAFQLHSQESAKCAYYDIVSGTARKLGVDDYVSPAKAMSDAIETIFERLTPRSYVDAVSTTSAKFLLQSSVLNADNIDELAKGYINAISKTVKQVRSDSDSDKEYISALSQGMVDFMVPLGVFSPDVAPNWAAMFTRELYSLTEVTPVIPQTLPDGFSKQDK